MLSRTVGMAKVTAEQGAMLAARSALFHSRASVLASHTYSVAEPSKAQMSASVAKGLAVEIAGTPAKRAQQVQLMAQDYGSQLGSSCCSHTT